MFVSVESNSRLKRESISIFAVHFYTIAACSAIFENREWQTEKEGRAQGERGCERKEDFSFRFDVEAKNLFTREKSVSINAPGIQVIAFPFWGGVGVVDIPWSEQGCSCRKSKVWAK